MIIGAGTHYGNTQPGLQQLQSIGVNSIRDDIRGRYTDQSRVAHFASTQNSVCVAHGSWKPPADGMQAYKELALWVVKNVPASIFEISNEYWHPGTGSPNDAVSYMELQKWFYATAKTVRPDAVILGGAGIPTGGVGLLFLNDCLALGLEKHCDGISLHPYNYTAPAPNAGNAMADTKNVMALYSKPTYITEFGWPTYAGVGGQTEQFQAVQTVSYLLRCLRDDRIKGAWIYDYHDDGTDPANREHNFGIVHNDYSPKPAFRALKTLIEALKTGWVMVGLSIDSALVTNWKASASTLSPPVREALRDVLQALRANHAAIAKPATVNGQSRVFIRAPVPTDALIPLLSERTTQITVTSIKTVGGKQLGDDAPIGLDAATESTHTTGVTLPGYAGW